MRRRAGLVAAVALSLCHGALACQPATGGALAAPFAALGEQGDLVLADGSRARLVGLRLATGPAAAAALADAAASWKGLSLTAQAPGAKPDRWGRIPAGFANASFSSVENPALTVLQSGLAMAWPPELPPNCRIPYLEAEEEARRARRGLWGVAETSLVDAARGEIVAGRAGDVVVMQGRVQHVGQTRRAVYLNFGARGAGASAELRLTAWRVLERQGWTRERLRGKTLRVRGLALQGRPATVLVSEASLIEGLD